MEGTLIAPPGTMPRGVSMPSEGVAASVVRGHQASGYGGTLGGRMMDTGPRPDPIAKPADEAHRMHGQTWGDDVRTHEYTKRRSIHPDLMKGPAIRVTQGMVRNQERVFDPLVQRYRDANVESNAREREENTRVLHLNRAQDVQLLREQPWNVVTNASRLEGIDQGIDPTTLTHSRARHGRSQMPDTFVDYNILSNMDMQEHHWAAPDQRPVAVPKEPRERVIPAFLQKDYNIVTTRYLHDHADQHAKDKELAKLEATAKHRERNRFNPLTQQFIDGDENLRMRNWEEAHKVEAVEKAQAQICPTVKNRESAYWNIVNHRQANADMLKWMDLAKDERKERYKNRYINENNLHVRDMSSDQIENERRLNRIAHERFAEPMRRGFDIVNNKGYMGKQGDPPYVPYPAPNPDVWERVQRCRDFKDGGSPSKSRSGASGRERAASSRQHRPREDMQRTTRSEGSVRGSVRSTRSRSEAGQQPRSSTGHARSEHARSERSYRSAPRPPPQPSVPPLNLSGPPPPPGRGGMVYSKPVA